MPNLLQRLIAATAIIFFLPLLLVVTVCSIVVMGMPILHISERSGEKGRVFRLLKFRSMVEGSGSDVSRITPYGEFLRKTSIDELPSLIHVVAGQMNLVGPRPLLPEYECLYDSIQRIRLDVKPGITGWAQVNGRNSIEWEEKFALDVWYVNNRSLLLDLKILIKTVFKVLACANINSKNKLTMPAYKGFGRK